VSVTFPRLDERRQRPQRECGAKGPTAAQMLVLESVALSFIAIADRNLLDNACTGGAAFGSLEETRMHALVRSMQLAARHVRGPVLRVLAALLVVTMPLSVAVAQSEVRPSERVVSGVIVRAAPGTNSGRIGSLAPGGRLEFIGEVPGWNRVRLPDGRTGFVSKAWTVVDGAAAVPRFLIHSIDVGTGLSVFVEGPDFALLYDAGSNDDTARGSGNRILAYLRATRPGLRVIDHLVLSHPHKDHVELMADILASYEVRNIWDSGRLHPICGYRYLLAAVELEPGAAYHDALGAAASEVRTFPAQYCYGRQLPAAAFRLPRGTGISSLPVPLGADASMSFLHADGAHHSSPNENSLVLRLDLGSRRLLFMGDAEAGGRRPPSETPRPDSIEGRLLLCCRAQLRSDILVAGHHGSMTSSRAAFLDAVAAAHFLVSAGPTRYGSVTLPDAVVIDEFARRGTVWRTDATDTACGAHPAKLGADADGEAGGCDNVLVTIDAANGISSRYDRRSD
jgi:beta-lactamase superfamily II metal-dependent hydrolase